MKPSADGEDDNCNEHAVFPRYSIGEIAIKKGTKPGTEFECGNKPLLDRGAGEGWEVCFEVLHNKDGSHDSLIITVHHATEGGEQTSHEDVRVVEHAEKAMLFAGIGAANDRLADFGLPDGFLEDSHD